MSQGPMRRLPVAEALVWAAGLVPLPAQVAARAPAPPALPAPVAVPAEARARVGVAALAPVGRLPTPAHRQRRAPSRPRRFRPREPESPAALPTPVTGSPCRPCRSILPAGLRLQ